MATLEVHDGEGRVQFIELARDHPVLFGTSAACDVILEGDGIRPVHGRIRWKKTRFRVEASPDATFVQINGSKMAAGSINEGDEISVGSCRIFLLRNDDTVDVRQSMSAVDDDRTRVQAAPFVHVAPKNDTGHQPRPVLPRLRAPEVPAIPMADGPGKGRGRSQSSARGAKSDDFEGPDVAVQSPARPFGRLIERLRQLTGGYQAPGQERILTSPLVLGLVVALALLVGMGFWLQAIIASTVATQTFNLGVQHFDDGDYRTAIRDFDAFVASKPHDERTGKARVLRAMANVRQYVSAEGGTWSSALEAIQEMVEQVGDVEEFRDARVDLAELLIKVGEGLADRARLSEDAKALAEAESTVPLHAQVAGEPARAFLDRSRLPAKLSEARAAVRKGQIRTQALAAMDKAISDGNPSRVYEVRDNLVDQYADLARSNELVARMTAANDLIRRAVVIDTKSRPADHDPRPELMGPPLSLVMRSNRDPAPVDPAADGTVFALADGTGYAIDGMSGAPLWQVPLGLASPFVPQAVAGESSVLAFDARFNELVKLDSRTGALRWRLGLGEPVGDPPLVLGNQLVQVLPSGKVILIALESGALQSTVNLGRPLARTPEHDESGEHVYVLGRQDCLFVLKRDPLSCVAVEYLGHEDGSIPCGIARLGRYLVIPENDSLADSRWHILVVDETGAKERPAQEVKVAGWTWSTPANSGSIVWATGDKVGYEAFAVGDYGTKTPFRSVARLTADTTASGPTFALARSDRELWVASSRAGRYELDAERGRIELKVPLVNPGAALAPIQSKGKHVVMTFHDEETAGVALWGIDSETGAIAWKTIVAAPWPTAPFGLTGSDDLVLFGRDGREIRIAAGEIGRGGFVIDAIPRPGEFVLPAGTRVRVEADGKAFAAIAPKDRSSFLWVQDPDTAGAWRKIGLPSPPAADPIGWGDGILIPGADTRAYLIDPLTSRSRAEPFVPKFDRDRQGTWLRPARLDQESVVLADDVGRVLRVAHKTKPVARLIGEAQAVLDQRIIADPASTGSAVIVVTADKRVRALAARDLSPVGSWVLDAPLAGPPIGIEDMCFVMDRAGGVMAFGRDGQRIWSIQLESAVVGAPQVRDQSVWLITQRGLLHVRALSNGQARGELALSLLPSGGLVLAAKQLLVPVGQGTLRTLTANPDAEKRP